MLGDHQKVEQIIPKTLDFTGSWESVFRNIPGLWRSETILDVKISFSVKFALDTLILKSMRPKIAKTRFVL